MDFTAHLDSLEPNMKMVRSWMMAGETSPDFVLAFQSRLSLMAMITAFKDRRHIAGAVSDEEKAFYYVKQHQPGMLFCSDLLDEGDGYSPVDRCKDLLPDLRVMMILSEANPDVKRAIALQVDVVCLDQELMGPEQAETFAMLSKLHGGHFVSPLALKHLKPELSTAESSTPSILNSREKEIINLMVNGLSDREIAERLKLSFHTVRDYNKSIRSKLGVKSKAQLANIMIREEPHQPSP
jgi:hypothetical protein